MALLELVFRPYSMGVTLNDSDRSILVSWTRKGTGELRLAKRATVVLSLADGFSFTWPAQWLIRAHPPPSRPFRDSRRRGCLKTPKRGPDAHICGYCGWDAGSCSYLDAGRWTENLGKLALIRRFATPSPAAQGKATVLVMLSEVEASLLKSEIGFMRLFKGGIRRSPVEGVNCRL